MRKIYFTFFTYSRTRRIILSNDSVQWILKLISLILEKFSSFIHSEAKSRIKKLIFSFRLILLNRSSGILYNISIWKMTKNKYDQLFIIISYFLKREITAMQQRVAFTRKSLYHVRWPCRNLRNRRINRTKSPFSVLSNILPPFPCFYLE